MRNPRGTYTRQKIVERRARQEQRQRHIEAIHSGTMIEELPEPLVPKVFQDIQELYWNALNSVSDPRNPAKRVYPLHQILHRVISGFIEGNRHIGVLFPRKRIIIESGKKKLGSLPTRKAVYKLLRRLDWSKANEVLHPLWKRLGYTPDLVVRRQFRSPKVILDEFRKENALASEARRQNLAREREIKERSKGMSAAKANRTQTNRKAETKEKPPGEKESKPFDTPVKIQHHLVIDGKAVKASYNRGVTERFVHVTEIRCDEKENRSRFIIGTRPTELDRNGEWGAALSVLDALTPLPGDMIVVVSGDAGFCVEEFCQWLTEKGFFLPLPPQRERR